MNGEKMNALGLLRYAGRGQIVRVSDGRLVSPREIVEAWNARLTANAERGDLCHED